MAQSTLASDASAPASADDTQIGKLSMLARENLGISRDIVTHLEQFLVRVRGDLPKEEGAAKEMSDSPGKLGQLYDHLQAQSRLLMTIREDMSEFGKLA